MNDSNSPNDPFEFFRKLWSPMGNPLGAAPTMPGAMPGMVFPSTNVEDIEKRIAELRTVEGWLALNLEMLRTMVQGLEAQRATLAAYQSMNQSMSAAAAEVMAAQRRATGSQAPDESPGASARRRKSS